MDEKTKHMCEGCMHGFCGGGHGALRWVIGALILIMIFWMGMRIGELKSEMYGDYGYGRYGNQTRMMRGGYNVYGPGMMYGYSTQEAPTTVIVPAAKTK